MDFPDEIRTDVDENDNGGGVPIRKLYVSNIPFTVSIHEEMGD